MQHVDFPEPQEGVATPVEMVTAMIIEAKNDLTRALVVDRLLVRKKLAAKLSTQEMNMDGANRMKISTLKYTIEELTSVHKSMLDEAAGGGNTDE